METPEVVFKKTRIAPTPSGYLHMGNALSFIITESLAKKTGAKILLRIDDLDRDRVQAPYVNDIFDTLHFLGIEWDEGPRSFTEYLDEYSQMHRMQLYREALAKLEAAGGVFACTCSRSQIRRDNTEDIYPGTCRHKNLPLDTPNACWRLKTDATEISVKTLLQGVFKTALPLGMQDFIVRKRDGYPAYQLASLVDDVHFGVDLIIRGEDLWPSTLAQLYLADVLGYNDFRNSTFHHHPLLAEKEGTKLSKSAGDTSIKYLREHGRPPGDIYSDIGIMLGADRCLGSKQELIDLVDRKTSL